MNVIVLLTALFLYIFQAFFTSEVNKGAGFVYSVLVFIAGLAANLLWIALSKVSTNIIRDALIWNIIVVSMFTIVFIIRGQASQFETKHWIGMGATIVVFGYWLIIK